mgnify:CR=1 FL=1
MYSFEYKPNFKRDLKKLKNKGYDLGLLDEVFDLLAAGDSRTLIAKYKDHQLKGNLKKYRELHVLGDWLLVYRVSKSTMTLILMDTGNHDHTLR